MNRRELFEAVAAGAGLTLGGARLLADDHRGKKEGTDKFMAPVDNHHLFFCGFHVAKKNPKIQVKTAVSEGQPVEFKRALAMPTRLEAIARVVGLALAPASRLVAQINAPAGKIASQIKTLREKAPGEEKPAEGGAPAATAG